MKIMLQHSLGWNGPIWSSSGVRPYPGKGKSCTQKAFLPRLVVQTDWSYQCLGFSANYTRDFCLHMVSVLSALHINCAVQH